MTTTATAPGAIRLVPPLPPERPTWHDRAQDAWYELLGRLTSGPIVITTRERYAAGQRNAYEIGRDSVHSVR